MRRLTKFAVRSASVAALLALALLLPTPTRADCVTPSGTIDSIPLSTDGSMRTFTGYVTPFGPVVGFLQLQINQSTGAFTGEFVIVAVGGTACGTIQGQFTSGNTYVEKLTFTGGTGFYTGISGYAYPVFGTLNPMTGTGRDTITGGQICLP
jgi:hypothetical protein